MEEGGQDEGREIVRQRVQAGESAPKVVSPITEEVMEAPIDKEDQLSNPLPPSFSNTSFPTQVRRSDSASSTHSFMEHTEEQVATWL